MKLTLLALDYDGTIAAGGRIDRKVRSALSEAREREVLSVLVTGRVLDDLTAILPHFSAFDAIVGENGAVLHFPRTGRSTLLAQPVPPDLAAELSRRRVPFRAGQCVVELDGNFASDALAIVRDLELPWILAFNHDRLMVLPQAISKGVGLLAAARALRVSPHNAIAFGDAENDHDLFRVCGHGIAVGWGSERLKREADEVLPGDGPPAVADRILRALDEGRLPRDGMRRRWMTIGERDGEPVSLALLGRNILIAGESQSGKSWLAGLVIEQLVLHRFCVCVIDPEGEYRPLEALPGVLVIESAAEPPSLAEIESHLRFPDVSLVIDLSSLVLRDKREYVRRLLRFLGELRRSNGLPHRIVVDEAHYFLESGASDWLIESLRTEATFVTHRVSALDPAVRSSAGVVLVSRESKPAEAELLRKDFAPDWPAEPWARTLASLEIDEAALLPATLEAGKQVLRFRVARRLTPHVRHQRKYLDVPVEPAYAFVFRREGVETGERARSLLDLIEILSGAPEQVYDHHLRENDFSRWIDDVFRDPVLAEEIRAIERRWRGGSVDRPHDRIVRAIERRYAATECEPIACGEELRARAEG